MTSSPIRRLYIYSSGKSLMRTLQCSSPFSVETADDHGKWRSRVEVQETVVSSRCDNFPSYSGFRAFLRRSSRSQLGGQWRIQSQIAAQAASSLEPLAFAFPHS